MNSSEKMLTFQISYGFLGGPLRGKKLTKLLKHAGYRQAAKDESCDIVIAHSTGTWHIPKARLVVYVDIPLLQDKPARTHLLASLEDIRSIMRWPEIIPGLRFLLHSVWYALISPVRNIKLIRVGSSGRPQIVSNAQTVYVANRDDAWQHSEQINEYLQNDWSFITLPGCHDDIWIHPDRYAEIINHYARLLA